MKTFLQNVRNALLWNFVSGYFSKEILCDSDGEVERMDQVTSMKVSGLICLTVFGLVAVSFLVLCWIMQRRCSLPIYSSDIESSSDINDSSATTSTNTSFNTNVSVIMLNDPPPSYEAGLRTETPPPSFESLFPTASNTCNNNNDLKLNESPDISIRSNHNQALLNCIK